MAKREKLSQEQAAGVHAKNVLEQLSASSTQPAGQRRKESPERRPGKEADSANCGHSKEVNGTLRTASSSKLNSPASCSAHDQNDVKPANEEARIPRGFPKSGSKKYNDTTTDIRKQQLEEDDRTRKRTSPGRSMPASLAVDVQGSETRHDDDGKGLVSGRKALPADEASQKQQEPYRTKESPSTEAAASPLGSSSSPKRNGRSPASLPLASMKRNASVMSTEQGDKNAAGEYIGKPTIGGWLNILRGAFSATSGTPVPEGEEAGSNFDSGVNSQRPVSPASPAKSDLRVKRRQHDSRQVHSQLRSVSQPSSYVQPHNASLSVNTRDVDSGMPVDEGDGRVEVGEVIGRWRCCTWFNVWLSIGVLAMVVVVPAGLILLPHKGHIYPHGAPDPRTVATSEKLPDPVIPLESTYNENELEGTPKCTFPARPIVEDLKAVTPLRAKHAIAGPQYRPVICVVDAAHVYVRQSSLGFGYDVKAVPAHYCTALVYYAAMFVEDGFAKFNVQHPFGETALRDLNHAADAKRRHQTIDVYLTIGGSRGDSFGIADMITQIKRWPMFNEFLDRYRVNGFEGVNLDWNRPGDECTHHIGRALLSRSLKKFISFLKERKELKVMLTVPPLLKLIESYNISSLLQDLDFVVVATHKLRRPAVVACSGERVLAATAFTKMRKHFLRPEDAGTTLRKLAYSITVGADIYKLTNGTEVKYLAPIKSVSTVFNRREIMPGKTSYQDVCNLAPADRDSLKECSVFIGSRTVSRDDRIEQEVAAIAGPEELKRRFRNSYEDGMGDTPVAVFDIIMDDSRRHCSETGSEAPLLQVIAQTGPP